MKEFLKTTLAVICGILVTTVVLFFIMAGIFGSMLTLGSSTPSIPKQGVLKIDMSRIVLGEQTAESDPLTSLTGSGSSTIGILDAVRAVKLASDDPAVQYIYLKTDMNLSEISYLEEFRAALSEFRVSSGKPIVSYIEAPGTGSYYLSSVADKIYMTPYLGATTTLSGVSSQMIFLGDLLDRLGVKVQLIRHGKYKSAGEMYTRSSSSAENREQNQRMVDALWETMRAEIAKGRDLSPEAVDAAINGLELNSPEDFLRCGFVDELLSIEQLKDKLAALAVKENFKDVSMIPFEDYVSVKTPLNVSKKKIAVIYANGDIVDLSDPANVDGDRFASLISQVRADSTIKAVVLRVNSPGGSVLAAEKIKGELDLLKAEKPVVASYGSYAASGGYWISANCDRIYSDATTLTGSIGVFGLIPDFSSATRDKLHVGVESVTSNRHGDMYSLMRPFDSAETAYMQKSIESIYERFTTLVSDGRSLPVETVDAIGQGRVWTGSDALAIGLVDEIGSLEDALYYAASCAGDPNLDAWGISAYPRAQGTLEMLLERLGGGSDSVSLTGNMESLFSSLDGPKVLARMDTCFEIK